MNQEQQWDEIMSKTTCANCKPLINYKFRCLSCSVKLMKLQKESPELYKSYKQQINYKIQKYKYTISEYYTCECGRTVREVHSTIYKHERSKIHIKYIKSLNEKYNINID